jgi:hypothetical protein
MSPTRLFFAILLVTCTGLCKGQGMDVREPFLGLYYTDNPPCINPNEQSAPNHYVRVEKDSISADSIVVVDTMYAGANGFVHYSRFHISDSTYFDGTLQGKFLDDNTLSIYVPDKVCPPGHIYHLRRLWPVVELPDPNDKTQFLYIFPQPAVYSFTVQVPVQNQKTELDLLDITGRSALKKEFYGSSEIDVRTLPRGVYIVHIQTAGFSLNRHIVLTN